MNIKYRLNRLLDIGIKLINERKCENSMYSAKIDPNFSPHMNESEKINKQTKHITKITINH